MTVVFCDVVGSTALTDRSDAEVLRALMNRFHEQVSAVGEAHGGTVEKFIGDAVLTVFGIPRLHEDDALRAVRAADAMRCAADEVDVRIGIGTGEVVTGEGRTIASGEALNLAARLQQAAAPGEVLLSEPTLETIRGAVEVEAIDGLALRGWREPVPAYRLVRITGDQAIARRMDLPLVGRDRERRFITDIFARVVADRTCHLVTVLGDPGIGKSRLLAAVVEEIGDTAAVLSARCRPYGESTALHAVSEIMAASGGPSLAECDYDDAFADALEHLEALARRQPLVVVFDDAHWAEPALLDLVDHLAVHARDVPMMILIAGRPELLDTRPGWGGGKANAASLRLAPLDPDATMTMIDGIESNASLTSEARRQVAVMAEGNPLFAEQIATVLHEGRADVPATLQALLSARLDALGTEEREVLERASIEGREFRVATIEALGANGDADGLRPLLEELVRRRLLRPLSSGEYRFHHELVRDAAYRSMPKRRRAGLHLAFADWLERCDPRRADIVGHHLAEAYRYRRELEIDDAETAGLARRAADALRTAGARAIAVGDSATACEELERAVRLTGDADVSILADLGVALHGAGRLEEAAGRLEHAASLAAARGEVRIEWRARVEWLDVAVALGRIDGDARRRTAWDAIEPLTEVGDDLGLARAWAALQDSERALAHARAAGARREESEILIDIGWAWADVPTTVGEAIERVQQLMAEGPHNRRMESGLGLCLGSLYVSAGRLEEAEVILAGGLEIYRALGRLYGAAAVMGKQALAALAAGDLALAERRIRDAIAIAERMGDTRRQVWWLGRLALILVLAGRPAEALVVADRAERMGPDEDWMAARALAQATAGDGVGALAWAGEALDVSRREPGPCYMARRAVAAGLAAARRNDEAQAQWDALIAEADRKGDWFEAEFTRLVQRQITPAD